MLNQLFISYRHESDDHARAVKRLGELLRQARLPVVLDQFYLDENPGGPDEGWPKWCEDCANNSACVIIIGSEGWFAAYDKASLAGTGLGAAAEADLIRQDVWEQAGRNTRTRVAYLHAVPHDQVPVRFRAWHSFRPLDDDGQLSALVRWAADCLDLQDIELPMVRWPEPLQGFYPDVADRTNDEWPAVVNVLAGRSAARIVFFEGPSGFGKSELLRQTMIYARRLDIPVAHIELKGGTRTLSDILEQLALDLDGLLPNFTRERASKTYLLRRDLRALRQPVVVIFDSYEDAIGNKSVADWVNQQFLPEVETARSLVAMIAGQKVPDCAMRTWRDLVLNFALRPINETKDWEDWVDRNHPAFRQKGADLRTVLLAVDGNPMLVSELCRAIARRN